MYESQNMIRENVRLAQKFEAMVRSDPRFEIPAARSGSRQEDIFNKCHLDPGTSAWSCSD